MKRLRFPIGVNGRERFQRACEWHLLTKQGQLRLALLTSTTVSAFERVSGVGRSTVVPLYIQWVEPRMFTTP